MATFTGADKAIAFLFDMVSNIADDYDSTSTYAYGDYAIYNGTLYKCAYTISTPEDFTPAHWQSVLVMDEVSAGGGGGGTTVIANPAGTATEQLDKLQVGSTIYSIPSGGSSGHTWATTEHAVGTWTDGKTVYERTYSGTVTGVMSGLILFSISDVPFDTMVSISGTFSYDANNNLTAGYVSLRWNASNVIASTSYTTASRTWNYTVTIQYTKTV